MKQMNLFTFLTKLSTKPDKPNKENERRIVRFSKSVSKQLSSEIENKENSSPKIFKQQKIGRLVSRLNTISYCDISKEDDDDSELEVINELAKGLTLERKERSVMEAHGFYSNLAVCLPSWGEPNQLTVQQLEADEVAFSIDGETHMMRTFGGDEYSDSVGKASSRKRARACLISSDDESVDGDFFNAQTEDNQWIVEKVLARRVVVDQPKSRSVQYFLKWKGWDYKHSTWEIHCKENNIEDLIMEFHDREVWRQAICRRIPVNERLYFYNSYMLGSLINCHQWEDEMNNLIKSKTPRQAPIYVENWVDEEAKPKKFEFILENRFSKETEKALQGIPNIEHCKCGNEEEKCGAKHDCCPYNFNQNYCYLEDGRIDSKQTYMNKYWIVECTDACKCGLTCPTRVVQRGRQIPIVIFRTLDRGWAVRTCVDIKKKSFVCEYVGEVLTDEESLESKKPSTYQFQMDGCGPKYFFIVDAAIYGNEARFVNHSCGPNLAVYPVFADRLDERYHRIAFFAKRDIKRGDELTIDYCAIDQFAKGRRQKQCNCKSKKCRGYFYY
uniref:Histone-lysine N-methyltransferase n=1 Tax=Meloidogyne incognita TaxID=6306 RepID=A0A914M159_MELIC